MRRTFAAAIACAVIAGLFVSLVWPWDDPRLPNQPTYSSTVYDPR